MRGLSEVSLGYDLVFVARQALLTAEYEQICRAVETILKRAALNKQRTEGTTT
jgi:RNase P protein component